MNKTSTLVVAAFMLLPFTSFSQYSPGIPANFGIDGDIKSGSLLSGTGNPDGTHDWFKKPGSGAGIGIIDTTGSSVNKVRVAAGQNFIFNKGMAFPKYSVQEGKLLLDARYSRDHFGVSGDLDLTTYTNGAKNGDIPNSWTTSLGAPIGNGDDIVDTYIHMRRDGTVINNTNPSPLIMAMGISTVGNTGERYCDFELFKSRIDYNATTGLFSNSGPVAKGGHSAWEFNADGSIKTIGDMAVSFAFNGPVVSQIAIWIWVNKNDYQTVNPQRFNFVSGEFYGNGNTANWGYAKIVQDAGATFNAWGAGASSATTGPFWGTNSKSIGGGSNYASDNYATGDFAEAAIDLTSLGVDPALSVGMDPCSPPFTRMIAKTRSSSSFTSALQDFTGPYEFLDAPQISPQIVTPAALKCNVSNITLSPASITPGAYYHWSTNNGEILTSPDAATITVNKAGKYYLTASIFSGCATNSDSTVVVSDYYKPVATATTLGSINVNDPFSFAQILGGDITASNYITPFGASAGLIWNWTGPNNYTSSVQNNNVTRQGSYRLILTEQRNGCKDTANTTVGLSIALPLKITDFSANRKDNDRVDLNWKVLNDQPVTIELMKSYNILDFSVVFVDPAAAASHPSSYLDNVADRTGNKVFYKLRITNQSGVVTYSQVLYVSFIDKKINTLSLSPNPAISYTVISVEKSGASAGTLQITDMRGKIIYQKALSLEKGTNQIMLKEVESLRKGIYIIRIISNETVLTQKLIKIE